MSFELYQTTLQYLRKEKENVSHINREANEKMCKENV